MNFRQAMAGLMFSRLEDYLHIQEAVMMLTGGPRLATVPVPGGHMRCYTSEKIYWLRDCFELENRAVLESLLDGDSVFYDIGAQMGFWEIALSSRCRQIYAFEPSPLNFKRLQEHVLLNGLQNVMLVNAAVSARSGRLRFTENRGMSHVAEEGRIEVQAICIDEFVCTNPAPVVTKIDVEGHAPQVLAGMSETLRRFRPSLLIEFHDEPEERAVLERLTESGYRIEVSGRRYPRCAVASGRREREA